MVNRNPRRVPCTMQRERRKLPCSATKPGWLGISMWCLRRRPSSRTSARLRKSVDNNWSPQSCSSRPSEADGRDLKRHDDSSVDIKRLERASVLGVPQSALLYSDEGTIDAEASVALRSAINRLSPGLDGRQRSPNGQSRL